MLTVVGSARNLTCLKVDGIDLPFPTIDVVLICHKPSYGFNKAGNMTKAARVTDLRFSASPNGLRILAEKLNTYANEAEAFFGKGPGPNDISEESGNHPVNVTPEACATLASE